MSEMVYVVKSRDPEPVFFGAFDSREEAKDCAEELTQSWNSMIIFEYVEVIYFASLAAALENMRKPAPWSHR